MKLFGKVEQAIRRGQLLAPGMRVAVACSGGADSVALAHLLSELKAGLGLQLLLVHLNHQLRGAESDADEALVRALAERLEIELVVGRDDVSARARTSRLNLEEAGREARLKFFSRVLRSGKADAVALAHTLDDQAETVLARLVRGAGTRGLAGIYPVVEMVSSQPNARARSAKTAAGRLVRPLLGIRRAALRTYLVERGESWREDSSNLDSTRLRNRLRLELLPQLTRLAGAAAVTHIARLADQAREEERFWSATLEGCFHRLVVEGHGTYELPVARLLAPVPDLDRLPTRQAQEAQRAVARRLVRRTLEAVRGHLRRITQAHVESVLRLAERQTSGRRVELPGVEVERQFDRVIFRRVGSGSKNSATYEVALHAPGEVKLPGQRALRVKLVGAAQLEQVYNKLKNVVDAERVRFPLVVRNWQPGDSYQPVGASRPKKLKTLFQRGRVPLRARSGYPVVVCGGEIIWVPGFGPASRWALRKTSEAALLLEEEQWTE